MMFSEDVHTHLSFVLQNKDLEDWNKLYFERTLQASKLYRFYLSNLGIETSFRMSPERSN